MKSLFTSESVTEGHPDKVCDQVSDAILDAALKEDPLARVAAETMATANHMFILGEVTCKEKIDYENIARKVIEGIGYTKEEYGFSNKSAIDVHIHTQSPDIALGVDIDGAGDQGIMFGYACKETKELMPFAIQYSNLLAKRLTDVRKDNTISYLRPDGKTQITVEYDENGKPYRIDTVLISTQHDEEEIINGEAKLLTMDKIKEDLVKSVILPVIPQDMMDKDTKILVNPTGRFVIGGPLGDTGLTGRKIIADTYGGSAPHGGGAFSGKDPTKVDRSAAYMARFVAKNLVAAGLCEKCLVQFAYAIGIAEPVSVMVNSYGTGKMKDSDLAGLVNEKCDLRPKAIIERLSLRTPIYQKTAAYGHFGRPEFAWEKIDANLF